MVSALQHKWKCYATLCANFLTSQPAWLLYMQIGGLVANLVRAVQVLAHSILVRHDPSDKTVLEQLILGTEYVNNEEVMFSVKL